MVTLVDDEDYEWLAAYRWSATEGRNGSFYAVRMEWFRRDDGSRGAVCRQMQRDILDPGRVLPRKVVVDHIDRDTLNNRRENLRLLSNRENIIRQTMHRNNTSGYRGVQSYNQGSAYKAVLCSFGTLHFSFCHKTPESAAAAYNWLAVKHHGEHAQLNRLADGAVIDPVEPNLRRRSRRKVQ